MPAIVAYLGLVVFLVVCFAAAGIGGADYSQDKPL
jgi:hypothetical protein